VNLYLLSKAAEAVTRGEKPHYEKGYLGPGVPARHRSGLPTVTEPETWEFSAHPHLAERAGLHTDIRFGNPETGIAHSFVMPKRSDLPGPGESVRVIPTFDHEVPYMDYTGPITTTYGKGVVKKGRREKAEVYHAKPGEDKETKLRFNLYEGDQPEEYSIRTDGKGKWFLHNKTQTRSKRPDIPSGKETYKEIDIDSVDPTDDTQVMMPKFDGAHTVLDLKAGRAPRAFSYRVAKRAKTGLIEHTHKMPELLKQKVPKELDNTLLLAETIGVRLKDGKAIPAEQLGGLLNAKVWRSREEQAKSGIKLVPIPFNVLKYKGKDVSKEPFEEKIKILEKVTDEIEELPLPRMVIGALEKIGLLNAVKSKKYPLTDEGVVLVSKGETSKPVKAKVLPDFDVVARKVNPAVSKDGKTLDRAGSVSYSWTVDGPIVGQVGGFKHEEGRRMLEDPDAYVGRVAKVKARKVFKKKDGSLGAMFQPRFKEWHLDKGDIEKAAFFNELERIRTWQ